MSFSKYIFDVSTILLEDLCVYVYSDLGVHVTLGPGTLRHTGARREPGYRLLFAHVYYQDVMHVVFSVSCDYR